MCVVSQVGKNKMDGLMGYVMRAQQEISTKTKTVTTEAYVDFICIIIESQVCFSLQVNIRLEQLQCIPMNNSSYILSVLKLVTLQYIDDVFYLCLGMVDSQQTKACECPSAETSNTNEDWNK